MESIYIVDAKDGPVACMLVPRMSVDAFEFCQGCVAYDHDDVQLCLGVDVDCYQNGLEVLAAVHVNVGTRFEGETYTGRVIKNAVVHSIVEWRTHPLQVYWTDELGKHIEPFHLTEFKRFKFI